MKMKTVRLGDIVYRVPHFMYSGKSTDQAIPGRVVAIHPEGRFHVVSFEFPNGCVREAFRGILLE